MAGKKSLIIVESPSKAHTVSKILGSDFIAKASCGHVRDLPSGYLAVDRTKDYLPKYEISKDKKSIVEDLRKSAQNASVIYLASDPDREGEAIAWHLQEVLKDKAKDIPFYRVQYNEVTAKAVKAAIANPGEIDMNRVNAQQTRRILDRLIGYELSPVVMNNVQGGRSAGRVQSAALRLICEREREISAFTPIVYWLMGAHVAKGCKEFDIRLARVDGEKPDIKAEELANDFLADLKDRALRVKAIKTTEKTRRPLPPFRTSTLQQAASSMLGYSPKRTMDLAQKLYENGFITYMRTDSTNISVDARKSAAEFIARNYGKQYVPEKENYYGSTASAQDAHEAIRPANVDAMPQDLRSELDAPSLKLYDLIWRRFTACLMTSAKLSQRTVEIESTPPPAQKRSYLFTASTTDVVFDGFLRVMKLDIRKKKPESEDDNSPENDDDVTEMPSFVAGDEVVLLDWICDRKETTPPPHYNAASLIRKLEETGIGRPSTYATVIDTLQKHKYIDGTGKQMLPTPVGFNVNDYLVKNFDPIVDVGFTAGMEKDLDSVADGDVDPLKILKEFDTKLEDLLAVPPAKAMPIMNLFQQVTEWAEPHKKGRYLNDDKVFVEECRQKCAEGHGISPAKFSAIQKLALKYRDQIKGINEAFETSGFEVPPPPPAVTDEELKLRFDSLENIELAPFPKKFLASIKRRVKQGGSLSIKQLTLLDSIIRENAENIENYTQLTEKIKLTPAAEKRSATTSEADEIPDPATPKLLEALTSIKEWAEPVTKGKKTYDDKEIFESFAKQFKTRKRLTPRQIAVLRRIVIKYKTQITDYEKLAEECGLLAKTTKTKTAEKTATK